MPISEAIAARLEDALDIRRGSRQLEGVGILAHHPVDDVHLLQRGGDRLGPLEGGGHVDRPELTADAALAQAGDVGVDLRLRLPDVERVEVALRVVFLQRHRKVVVAVDQRRGAVQRPGAGEEVGLLRGEARRSGQQEKDERALHACDISVLFPAGVLR